MIFFSISTSLAFFLAFKEYLYIKSTAIQMMEVSTELVTSSCSKLEMKKADCWEEEQIEV